MVLSSIWPGVNYISAEINLENAEGYAFAELAYTFIDLNSLRLRLTLQRGLDAVRY